MNPEQTLAKLAVDLNAPFENVVSADHASALRGPENRVPEGDLRIIINTVAAIQPGETLEVGLATASTAIAIMAAKPEGSSNHIALDPAQTSAFHNAGVERIEKLGLAPRFELIEKSSHIALPTLLIERQARFDFVYIDGCHMFDYTLLEWFYSDKMLNIGGVIAFDDCMWPMVHAVASFVETNCNYTFLKPNERTWLAVKMGEDRRKWLDFSPFTIPAGHHYDLLFKKYRK